MNDESDAQLRTVGAWILAGIIAAITFWSFCLSPSGREESPRVKYPSAPEGWTLRSNGLYINAYDPNLVGRAFATLNDTYVCETRFFDYIDTYEFAELSNALMHCKRHFDYMISEYQKEFE